VEFAFAQLSEIAIRALSPAINDTYTGLSCIDWHGDALRMFAAAPALDGVWHTETGQIRLFTPPLRFSRVLNTAFDLIIEAGIGNSAVIIRLLQTCARLLPQLPDEEQRDAVRDKIAAIRELALTSAAQSRACKAAIQDASHLADEAGGAKEPAQPTMRLTG